jgi:hypothetical protein
MPLPLVRYPLDPTGVNPDNAIAGEIHTLNIRRIRAVAPTYGPFFTQSLLVYDRADNRQLIRGTDYQCVELLQEATLRFGKEISEIILILDPTVSNEVIIYYQTLGGMFQNNAAGIVNMYETAMMDHRPVDWVNVLNKPYEYPPSLHNHLLTDLYGFDVLVVALERIRNAILLSDVPAFESLITYVDTSVQSVADKALDVVSEEEITNSTSVNKVVTFERLLFALDKLNFNGITLWQEIAGNRIPLDSGLVVNNGDSLILQVSSTNILDTTSLYWSIEHVSTQDVDFGLLSGIINIAGNRGRFIIPIAPSFLNEYSEKFKVTIRKNGISGPVLLSTSEITIRGNIAPESDNPIIMDYLLACCLYNPSIDINPQSLFLVEDN